MREGFQEPGIQASAGDFIHWIANALKIAYTLRNDEEKENLPIVNSILRLIFFMERRGVIMEYDSEIFQRLVARLLTIFGQSVHKIILYGSFARGTSTSESDIDIAVIVGAYTANMHDEMTDFIVELELEYDKVLSVLLIDYNKFKDWENIMPFYKNIKKEGITLWQAA